MKAGSLNKASAAYAAATTANQQPEKTNASQPQKKFDPIGISIPASMRSGDRRRSNNLHKQFLRNAAAQAQRQASASSGSASASTGPASSHETSTATDAAAGRRVNEDHGLDAFMADAGKLIAELRKAMGPSAKTGDQSMNNLLNHVEDILDAICKRFSKNDSAASGASHQPAAPTGGSDNSAGAPHAPTSDLRETIAKLSTEQQAMSSEVPEGAEQKTRLNKLMTLLQTYFEMREKICPNLHQNLLQLI